MQVMCSEVAKAKWAIEKEKEDRKERQCFDKGVHTKKCIFSQTISLAKYYCWSNYIFFRHWSTKAYCENDLIFKI